ncbi:hypothetical protein BH23VER1_BH23VER1_02610 [soil metagenome]
MFLAAPTLPDVCAELRAGAASVDVTPHHLPVGIAGSIAAQETDTITSPLHAKAIVLDDGETRVGIAVVDNCLLPRDLIDSVKAQVEEATGIPADRILVSATHTHSAPPVVSVHGNDPEPDYRIELEGKIVLAFRLAADRLAPAEVATAAGDCPEHVFCRRWLMKPGTAFAIPFTDAQANHAQMNPGHQNANRVRPTGPVDPQVTVLAMRGTGGNPIALLANYSTHYVGDSGISADYFGAFGDRIGPMLGAAEGSGFVGILSNGTSGDANCVDFSRDEPDSFNVDSVSQKVAEVVMAALEGANYRRDLRLDMRQRQVEFAIRQGTPDEVAAARAFLDENLGDRPVKTWEENYARETVLLSEMPARRTIILQALAIGDAFAITAIPCEVYGSTGLAIKGASVFPMTMNISMANGAEGYLPPPDQFPLGGYTTWRARSSCLEKGAEPLIRTHIGEMLVEMAPAP